MQMLRCADVADSRCLITIYEVRALVTPVHSLLEQLVMGKKLCTPTETVLMPKTEAALNTTKPLSDHLEMEPVYTVHYS